MLTYKANEYITLKLENKRTQIYVKNRPFTQCIRLVLNIPTEQFKDYDKIDSIDEAADVHKRKSIHQNEIIHEAGARNYNIEHNITPEQEFWGHCSNIQTWVEHKYDTRLLHSNLSFPLLRQLYKVGDPMAKRVYREEIAMRLESGSPMVIEYLWRERMLDYLSLDDLAMIIESSSFVENLIENMQNFRTFELIKVILFKLEGESSKDVADIPPHIINIFSDFICTLIKKGRKSYVRDCILGSSGIPSVINFFEKIRAHNIVIDLCNAALTIVPDFPWIWNALGYALTMIGHYPEAIDAYKMVLKYMNDIEGWNLPLNEKDRKFLKVVVWNNLAWAYIYIGEYEIAIDACNNAIRLEPTYANPYSHLGFAYYKNGQKEKGIDLLKKAIGMNPKYPRAFSNLGRIYYEQREYEQAYEVCAKCLKIDEYFKDGLLLLKDLINNPEVIDKSLTDFTADQKLSERYVRFLKWVRKKHRKKNIE
ncbi:MAG: tetratricopeptide repeat protein [Promethearchaeota archaeon]